MSEEQTPYMVAAEALRPPIAWQAVQSCFDDPIFNASRTAELLLAVGRPVHGNGLSPERMQEELREITAHFAFDRYNELQPSTSKRDAQTAKLASACKLVLEAAGMKGEPTPGDLLPFLGRGGLFAAAHARGEPHGEAATMNALRAVWQLRQDAEHLRGVYRRREAMKGERKGRQEERAIKRLAANLSTLYWLTWVEPPTASLTDEGGPRSSFLRLFVHVQEALRNRGADTHIREPDALRQVWQRLDDWEACRFKSSWTAADQKRVDNKGVVPPDCVHKSED